MQKSDPNLPLEAPSGCRKYARAVGTRYKSKASVQMEPRGMETMGTTSGKGVSL